MVRSYCIEALRIVRSTLVRMQAGPESVSTAELEWATRHAATVAVIEFSRTKQNTYIEPFNRSIRNEVLRAQVFTMRNEVRELSEASCPKYQKDRRHDNRGNVQTLTYLPRPINPELSNIAA